MAVVWLNTSTSNWSTASNWDYWDEDTQSVQPYGKVPQQGDTVYLNGYTVSQALANLNLGNGTLRNDENPYTGRTGGIISGNLSFINYVCNMVVGSNHLIQMTAQTGTTVSTITGNISNEGSSYSVVYFTATYTGGWYRNFSITGNITIGNNYVINHATTGYTSFPTFSTLTIVGNVTSTNNNYAITYKSLSNVTVNGNVSGKLNKTLSATVTIGNVNIAGNVEGNISSVSPTTLTVGGNLYSVDENLSSPSTLTVDGDIHAEGGNISGTILNANGNIYAKNNYVCTATTMNIKGNIYYENNNGGTGVRFTNLNILNPDTFTWKDITEPRSNPFIIVTDAEMNNRPQYPPEDEVKEGTEYVWGEKVGTYQQPPESVVLKGFVYDNGDKIGSLENQNVVGCVTKEDVREGVPLLGMGEVGTLVVPSVDDVREGVVFDNGSVGTLIVEGGGDRLRIADFGYYTNAQSDTYIVDLTEQDKPKFAVAEERVLIEMFPDLDLDNIPDKYFDDLFVKYLKYRLIVEYYRTAGINSTFTPSEPTTEIVNYQNVRNEVWLNSANIYLKAWAKKYPESIMKPQRILL